MNFLLGLFLVVTGTLMLVYNQRVFNFTGRISFVESKMPGGSSGFLKLVAVVMVIIGLLFVTGLGGWLTQPISDGVQNTFGGLRQP